MKPIYNKYKSKTFELVAVSWDYSHSGYIKSSAEAKADWKKAINRHQFYWTNLFDDSDKVMGGLFACVGKNILINPQCKIIAYNIKPLEIELILEKANK
jgi:hypothetical protein